MYTVTIHQPACLPESEPVTFDDLTEARRYIADSIERAWDEDYDGLATVAMNEPDVDPETERLRIDALYLDAHTEAALINAPASLYAAGYYYTLEVADAE